MFIKNLAGIAGARQAKGLVIIVDIMRAATVEAYAFGNGAKYIIPVATKEEAFAIKSNNPDVLLMGEENGYKIKDFDFGNSPSEIARGNIKDRILVHRTSSGTQGLASAILAQYLIFGSFVTYSSILKYIMKTKHEKISIVSMDAEDTVFSNFLEMSLMGIDIDRKKAREALYKNPGISWFLDKSKLEFPEEDIDYALDFDKFNFLCIAKRENSQLIVTPVKI
ncbi:MAG: 2-phosphosulfolactate phosphatase [Candidatus Levybacteria bacterium]|nr:2-phosphosulfolactate phosphatase [Candidatus Levybacteria bacterium]